MFDFFKKKKKGPDYDITNLTLHDLDVGFIVDYDMKSWEVKEMYEYDWGNNNFSKEYKLDSGDETGFLGIEDKGEILITFVKPVKIRKIEEDIVEKITKDGKAPSSVHYEGETYYLDSDTAGYFRDCAKETEDWEELVAYEYYTDEENKIISIAQWDERNFEASAGITLEAYHFSNILPGNN